MNSQAKFQSWRSLTSPPVSAKGRSQKPPRHVETAKTRRNAGAGERGPLYHHGCPAIARPAAAHGRRSGLLGTLGTTRASHPSTRGTTMCGLATRLGVPARLPFWGAKRPGPGENPRWPLGAGPGLSLTRLPGVGAGHDGLRCTGRCCPPEFRSGLFHLGRTFCACSSLDSQVLGFRSMMIRPSPSALRTVAGSQSRCVLERYSTRSFVL
mmetsp:Transcript_53871/g.144217  ORF Transcript_53871/g.144217 Transcript_53871/m.144217 type:complete len:210 (-) Transcript_53871:1171-1800(-)